MVTNEFPAGDVVSPAVIKALMPALTDPVAS